MALNRTTDAAPAAPDREAEWAAMRKCCEHCESPGHPNFCRFNGERDNHGFWCPECHPDVAPPSASTDEVPF